MHVHMSVSTFLFGEDHERDFPNIEVGYTEDRHSVMFSGVGKSDSSCVKLFAKHAHPSCHRDMTHPDLFCSMSALEHSHPTSDKLPMRLCSRSCHRSERRSTYEHDEARLF